MSGLLMILLLSPLWLALIPILIHLINMLRHRRVRWAAMEFLLVSQKKHRTWVIFKQLLLLLLRMAIVTTIVVMLFWPGLGDWLADALGRVKPTHHIVLVDDSYSMADRSEESAAIDRARRFVREICGDMRGPSIGETEIEFGNPDVGADDGGVGAGGGAPAESFLGSDAGARLGKQRITLLRFSRAAQVAGGSGIDLYEAPVEPENIGEITRAIDSLKIAPTSAGPLDAILALDGVLSEEVDENRVLYIVSDFRAKEWSDSTELRKQLDLLAQAGIDVRLIACSDPELVRDNLAVTSLQPLSGIRAAGIPMFMEVTVKNFGKNRAREVTVLLRDERETRPVVTIPEIGPGREATARFQTTFVTTGTHRTTALIQGDPLSVDDARHGVVSTEVIVPILVIGEGGNSPSSRYLSWLLAPGGSANTGIRAQLESPRFLNNPDVLDPFAGIILTDVGRLDQAAIASLRHYIETGGRVAIFVGPDCLPKNYNDLLYREGAGWFPAPLLETRILPVPPFGQQVPSIEVKEPSHPIFQGLVGARYDFLSTVQVDRYLAVEDKWRPESDESVQVLAELRDGGPLVIEKRLGEGRVIACLTTAAPAWNDWAKNPSFVITVQNLAAFLAQRPGRDVIRRVGAPLVVEGLDADEYASKMVLIPPSAGGFATDDPGEEPAEEADAAGGDATGAAATGEDAEFLARAVGSEGAGDPLLLHAQTENGLLSASLARTDRPGIYDVQITRTLDGELEHRLFAFNVDPSEGDIETLDRQDLAERLAGVPFKYEGVASADFVGADAALFGLNLGIYLLILLVLFLIGEQILAWSCGYHPPRRSSGAVQAMVVSNLSAVPATAVKGGAV